MIHFRVQGRNPAHVPIRSLPRIARECSLLRASLRSKPHDVSISFVTPSRIQKLNKTYRNINRPTDVLSFSPITEARAIPTPYTLHPTPQSDLGDLFICLPYVFKEAKRRREDPDTECIRMVVHGTLHLLGFDHKTAKEERRMFGVQERIIKVVRGTRAEKPAYRVPRTIKALDSL